MNVYRAESNKNYERTFPLTYDSEVTIEKFIFSYTDQELIPLEKKEADAEQERFRRKKFLEREEKLNKENPERWKNWEFDYKVKKN